MSKEMAVIALGLWVLLVPYLGVPGSWRTAILIATGLIITAIGFLLRGEALSRGIGRSEHRPFVENTATPPRHENHEGINSLN